MYSVGNQIGVGKESGALAYFLLCHFIPHLWSDIYAVADAEGNQMVLKLHRFLIIPSNPISNAYNPRGLVVYPSELSSPNEIIWERENRHHGCTCHD